MSSNTSESDLYREIADQLICATPESWTEAWLRLAYRHDGDVDYCTHEIAGKHPEEVAVATDRLYEATRALVLYHKRMGSTWKSAEFHVVQLDDGSWKFTVDFTWPPG